VADCCEHGNEFSGSIKGGNFLDQHTDLISQEALYSRVGLPDVPVSRGQSPDSDSCSREKICPRNIPHFFVTPPERPWFL
jgi:hypothetical protein